MEKEELMKLKSKLVNEMENRKAIKINEMNSLHSMERPTKFTNLYLAKLTKKWIQAPLLLT